MTMEHGPKPAKDILSLVARDLDVIDAGIKEIARHIRAYSSWLENLRVYLYTSNLVKDKDPDLAAWWDVVNFQVTVLQTTVEVMLEAATPGEAMEQGPEDPRTPVSEKES